MKVKEEGIVFNFGFKISSIKCLRDGSKKFSSMMQLYITEKINNISQEIKVNHAMEPNYKYSNFLLEFKIYDIEKNIEDIPNLYKKIKKKILKN